MGETTATGPAAPDTAEPRQEPAVAVTGLRMRYAGRDVLDGLDLEIRRGELFALLGPNGAGKSTTIEVLEGYRRRSAGSVAVLGRDPEHDDAAWRARIGIVLQSGRDHGRWRVGELLAHLARYYADPLDPDELLRTVGLAEQAGQQMSALSGGQRRRLDVALGVIGRPELLFLDEPTTGFDPQVRRDFHALLRRLRAASGMTIVLTTHDMSEAQQLADRIGILQSGRLTACGTLPELAAAARARSEVRWTGPDGTPHRLRTSDPSRAVWQLHQEFCGPIPGLEVRRPTLEDTYLGMVSGNSDPVDAVGAGSHHAPEGAR